MIPGSFCEELIKMGMDDETKARLKNEAKLIGAAAAGAGAAHGVVELGRYALKRKYGPQVLQGKAMKASRGALPAAIALAGYIGNKGYQKAKQRQREKAQAEHEQQTGQKAPLSWRQYEAPELEE